MYIYIYIYTYISRNAEQNREIRRGTEPEAAIRGFAIIESLAASACRLG